MNVFIPSIPHTASTFVAHQIFRNFNRRGAFDSQVDFGLYADHIGSPRLAELERAAHPCVTVIPMRHPGAVTMSWARRGYDLNQLHEMWIDLRRYENAFFLTVDTKDRNDRLQIISSAVGCELDTDWLPYEVAFGDGARQKYSQSAQWIVDRFYKGAAA